MPEPKVGTREEWLAARNELLELENEHAQRSEELARLRRELPWVPVEKEYSFETEEGTKTLAELFAGRSQRSPTTTSSSTGRRRHASTSTGRTVTTSTTPPLRLADTRGRGA